LQTFGAGVDHPLSKRDDADIEESAISFLQSHLGVDPETISYKSGYSGETAKHVYVGQTQVRISLLSMKPRSCSFNHDNKVVSVGSSFVTPSTGIAVDHYWT
jgi:extracellular elastinolytic metalloproteinase